MAACRSRYSSPDGQLHRAYAWRSRCSARRSSSATNGVTQSKLTGPGRDNTFFGLHLGPAYPVEAGKWDTIINPGTHAQPLSATGKLLYAGHEQIQPIFLVPAIFSAGYGQIADANPRYGIDSGGFGERFGAAMLRQATDRVSGGGCGSMQNAIRSKPADAASGTIGR